MITLISSDWHIPLSCVRYIVFLATTYLFEFFPVLLSWWLLCVIWCFLDSASMAQGHFCLLRGVWIPVLLLYSCLRCDSPTAFINLPALLLQGFEQQQEAPLAQCLHFPALGLNIKPSQCV